MSINLKNKSGNELAELQHSINEISHQIAVMKSKATAKYPSGHKILTELDFLNLNLNNMAATVQAELNNKLGFM